jgi:hypothetical protein
MFLLSLNCALETDLSFSVGFEVLASASMKTAVLSVEVPCSLIEAYRRLRGTYCLHLQGDDSFNVILWRMRISRCTNFQVRFQVLTAASMKMTVFRIVARVVYQTAIFTIFFYFTVHPVIPHISEFDNEPITREQNYHSSDKGDKFRDNIWLRYWFTLKYGK